MKTPLKGRYDLTKVLIAVALGMLCTGCAELGPALQGLGRDIGTGVARNGEQCGSQWNPCNVKVVR